MIRSSHSVSLALAVALSACGNDSTVDCSMSALTYQTFGEPFMTNWCRGCHSADIYPMMRQDAPLDINFDTLDQVRQRRVMIETLTVKRPTMPPAGGPSAEERALLDEWLTCGVR
jgi:uncharacterized membrane protein